jgi:ABC-type branched-subunit amino acid transport system ATPase component
MSLLTINSLESGYGRLPILLGIDQHIDEGELVAVIGPNGADKSTLFQTITGLLPCWKGQVDFDGKRVHDYEPGKLPTCGLGHVPQERNVFPELTVAENLEMAATPLKDRTIKIEAAYERFPILGECQKQLARTTNACHCQHLDAVPQTLNDRRADHRSCSENRGRSDSINRDFLINHSQIEVSHGK